MFLIFAGCCVGILIDGYAFTGAALRNFCVHQLSRDTVRERGAGGQGQDERCC